MPNMTAVVHRKCAECGVIFVMKNKRQRFCTTPCNKRQWARLWGQANCDKVRAKNSRHYHANKEKARQRARAWRKANPDRVQEHRRRDRERHAAQRAEYTRLWREANPGKAIELNRRSYEAWLKKKSEADFFQTLGTLVEEKL